MQMKMWFALGLSGFIALASGCVCSPVGSCGGGGGLGILVSHQASSSCGGACESACDSGSCDTRYAGRGPLASLLGLTSCSGGGCGELYVDEWINEPPTADHCGYGECLDCGRTPIRSLFQAILGHQYVGECETCGSDGGISVGHGPVLHDGYETGSFSSKRSGCSCGGHGSHGSVISDGPSAVKSHSPTRLDSVSPTVDPTAIPGQSIIDGSRNNSNGANGRTTPTPAPTLAPASAYRLNPATRRVVR